MPRLDSLTGLRWWAAFAVFAHHMTNLAPLPVAPALAYGTYGVTFFFVLSGFVLTWSSSAGTDAPTFWWRRFARIYPAHFVALIAAVPLFYSFHPDPGQWWVKTFSVPIILLSVVLAQGWSRNSTILFSGNPAAWTLSCEAFFYALHPALNRALSVVRRRGALIAGVVTFGLAVGYKVLVVLLPSSALATAAPWPLVRISEFVIGMAMAWAVRCGWRPRLNPYLLYATGLGAVVYFLIAPKLFAPGSVVLILIPFTNEVVIAICALLIVAIALGDLAGRFSLLSNRFTVRLGEWSYSFYLVHALVIYGIRSLTPQRLPSWSNLFWYLGVLALSLIATAALHFLVERPADRLLREFWQARTRKKPLLTEPSVIDAAVSA